MCGAVLSAVSPAAVVPRMVRIYEEGYGRKHSAPQLVLAGASLLDLLNVPLSIMTGIFFGILCGTVLYLFFESRFKKGQYVRNSEKAVIILALGLFLSAIEDRLPFAFSGLLAVMAMACVIRVRGGKLGLGQAFPEVRKAVDSLGGAFVHTFGRGCRCEEYGRFGSVRGCDDSRGFGIQIPGRVALSLAKTPLDEKERLFCVLSYIPKATVQSAIGGIALEKGLACGEAVLSCAVWSIILTAPLGAFLIDRYYKKLLEK